MKTTAELREQTVFCETPASPSQAPIIRYSGQRSAVMDHKGLLVLVFGLGAAIGAVVQWTELNEAKVGKKINNRLMER